MPPPTTRQTYTFTSQRQVGHIDHVNILLEASGDVLTKSGSERETGAAGGGPHLPPRLRRKDAANAHRDGEDAAGRSLLPRGLGHLQKGTVVQNPTLRPESRLVGVEIVGGKETLFSPKGPFNMDELELVTAVGESLLPWTSYCPASR